MNVPNETLENRFVRTLKENEIFVFGSNLKGAHGRGAAKYAAQKFGARYGQGTGLMGQCYGIATKDRNLKVLSLDVIENQIRKFLLFATEKKDLTFIVTPIGCGLAGYKPSQIAPLFYKYNIPDNVRLPDVFLQYKMFKED